MIEYECGTCDAMLLVGAAEDLADYGWRETSAGYFCRCCVELALSVWDDDVAPSEGALLDIQHADSDGAQRRWDLGDVA